MITFLANRSVESFNVVPDYFAHQVAPLVLRRQVPIDICHQAVDLARSLEHELSLTPKGKNASVDTSFRASKTVRGFNRFDMLAPYNGFDVLEPFINAHWNLGYEYDHIPEMKHLYTIFESGNYLRNHTDVIWDQDRKLVRPTRRLSILTYLTSCKPTADKYSYSGGELMFPSLYDTELRQIVSLSPQAGDIIITPANDNYQHLVAEILAGERHNIVTFTRFK